MIKEACVESLQEALLAQDRGADRIELCADLDLDGLTPSFELVADVEGQLEIPVRVMIRPRGGDFTYSRKELHMMMKAIDMCSEIGVEGVVFGVLTAENELDTDSIGELAQQAYPLKVTIHKAIDLTPDPAASIRSLLHIKEITGVLSSGGAATATEGIPVLQKMIMIAEEDMEVIVAGRVTSQNIDFLHRELRSREYHGRKIVGDLLSK